MNLLPEGLWPVMLTPFTATSQVDQPGLERLTDFYLEAGSAGLFANCLSSEMYHLTDEERLLIARTVVRQVKGAVPVVATGTFHRDPATCAAFVRQMQDTGVTAVVLISGILADPEESEAVLEDRIEAVMAQTEGIPLGLYECPMPYKRLLSPELLARLAQTGRFLYLKDTSCDPDALRRKTEAVAGTSLGLYNADTATALESLAAGGRGLSPIGANFYPELYTYLLRRFAEEGRSPELTRLHALLTMMDRVVHHGYPYAAKVFLQERGLAIETRTRLPAEALSPVEYLRLKALREAMEALADLYAVPLLRQP